jgi:hypothetical protein
MRVRTLKREKRVREDEQEMEEEKVRMEKGGKIREEEQGE